MYYVWTDIKRKKFQLSEKEKDKILGLLEKVALENQQSANFFFVKGLLMKCMGSKQVSYDLFTKAILLDQGMVDAYQERYSLGLTKKSKGNSFMNLFRKKKKAG